MKGRQFLTRLDGSQPLIEVFAELSMDQAAYLTSLLNELGHDTEKEISDFLHEIESTIAHYRGLRRLEENRLTEKEKVKTFKSLQKKAGELLQLLEELTPQHRTTMHIQLQYDDYQTGKWVPPKLPGNPPVGFCVSFQVLGNKKLRVDEYIETLSDELDRMVRICQTVTSSTPQGGRPKTVSPEAFARDVKKAYQTIFHTKPLTTRESAFEEIVHFTGNLAGFETKDWHRYILM